MPAPLLSREDAITRIAEVFREQGFAGTSLSSLTQATGLGKGSLYHYFPGGKEEMASAVLTEIDTWFEMAVFAPLEATADIDAMFAAVNRYFDGGGRICLLGAFALDSTRDRFAAALHQYFVRWIEVLQAALEKQGHPQASAEAELIVAGIQGSLTLSRACGNPGIFQRQMVYLRTRLQAQPEGSS